MDFGLGCALREGGTSFAGGGSGLGAAWLHRRPPLFGRPVSRMRRGPRLSTRAEFSRVYREGRRYAGESLVLYVRQTEASRRTAVTAGRGLSNAVARNRAKRRLREALRKLEDRLCPRGDIVVVARSRAGTTPFPDIVAEMESLCVAGRLLCENR